MRKIDVLKNATLEETAEWLAKVTMSSVMAGATDERASGIGGGRGQTVTKMVC
jgi:hypothetical protein